MDRLPTPPGYATLKVLDRGKHRSLGIAPARRAAFIGRLHAVPVTVVEFAHAARHYPVVFVQDQATERFAVLAVTGLVNGTNLFAGADGGWEPFCYVPAYVRRWPLYTLPVERTAEGKGEAVICVDEEALTADAAPLFDERGEPTAAWSPLHTLASELEGARLQTERFLATLTKHGLLEPFQAHAFPHQGRDFHITGMYRVSETKLNALDGRTFKNLARQGELSRIYAHLLSLDNFRHLMDRSIRRDGSETADKPNGGNR